MDFVVVVTGIVTMAPGMPNITVLRSLRVMKPLRTINKIKSMRVLVTTLLNSIVGLFNVMVFLGFMFVLFSILGS
jgi:hypothetical protein